MNILNCREYIENCLQIQTKDGDMQPLILNPPQQRLYAAIAAQWKAGKPVRIIILKARQMGFSTLTEAILFWLCATASHTEAMVVAHDDKATAQIFQMSRRYYDYLPKPLQPMMQASNAQELVFDRPAKSRSTARGLGSRIRCSTAGGHGIGRGYTLRAVHLSEYAFWPGEKAATYTGIAQAVPDKPGTLIIIESTANGYDDFKAKWDAAVQAQRDGTDGFTPIFFAWHEMPEYQREPLPGFERTQDEEKLAETYGLNDRQLAWRRWCIANNCGGDVNLFKQEYPASPDEAFLATGSCVFDKELLVMRRAQVIDDQWERGVFRIEFAADGSIEHYTWTADRNGPIRIRKHPEQNAPYVIGADTAGDGSDYFAAHVLDNKSGEQIAVLHHRYGEREFAQQIYCLGMYYNAALIGIETNYSTYPELKIEEYGYKNLYVRQRIDTYTGKLTDAFGFATTSKSRPLIIDGLKDVLTSTPEAITDYDTMGEMLTFVRDEHWKAAAEEGAHDDLVMSLAIAHFIRPQQRNTDLNEKRRTRWTADMWEDYYNADNKGKAELLRMWGEPE